ncbi:MAG: ribosome silencing factor [Desulfobacterales bacterium]|nr:ribosome silencing factor [Desulfobacterales bacterium]MCP4162336.1 ribosome silencing factor [Deltaproteobacteria bacterium]
MTEMIDKELVPFIKAVTGKKALDIVVLDVQQLTSYTDYLIVATGTSTRQVSAIAEHIKKETSEIKIKPLSIEGLKEGQWVLMDYGDIIIHLFVEETRMFYDIEGLWADAENISIDSYIQED